MERLYYIMSEEILLAGVNKVVFVNEGNSIEKSCCWTLLAKDWVTNSFNVNWASCLGGL